MSMSIPPFLPLGWSHGPRRSERDDYLKPSSTGKNKPFLKDVFVASERVPSQNNNPAEWRGHPITRSPKLSSFIHPLESCCHARAITGKVQAGLSLTWVSLMQGDGGGATLDLLCSVTASFMPLGAFLLIAELHLRAALFICFDLM